MTADVFWRFFCETGEPVYYLLYFEVLSLEKSGEKSA